MEKRRAVQPDVIESIGQKSIKKREKNLRRNLLGKQEKGIQNEFLQEYPTNIIEYEQQPNSDDNSNHINFH